MQAMVSPWVSRPHVPRAHAARRQKGLGFARLPGQSQPHGRGRHRPYPRTASPPPSTRAFACPPTIEARGIAAYGSGDAPSTSSAPEGAGRHVPLPRVPVRSGAIHPRQGPKVHSRSRPSAPPARRKAPSGAHDARFGRGTQSRPMKPATTSRYSRGATRMDAAWSAPAT